MKKWAAFILGLFLLLLCLSGTAEEEVETYTCGNYTYSLNEDGTATIVKWNGNNTELEISDTLDGHIVSSIGKKAFYLCSSLTSISIPDSVASIGDHAFDLCTNLTGISIPDGVTSIGDHAFSWCSSLYQHYCLP